MPATVTPLLTPAGLTICDKFSTDLANLCNAASQAGMTPNMISGQMLQMAMMTSFEVRDEMEAAIAAATPAPGAAPSWQPVEVLNGASTPAFGPGSWVRLILADGLLATTPADDTVVAQIALGAGYSFELRWGASTGFTYTVNGLWPGFTVYGAAGDALELGIGADGIVQAVLNGKDLPFFIYSAPLTEARVVQAFGGSVQSLQ